MARVLLDPAAIRRLLESPTGAVARDLTRRAIRVESLAKTLCPVDKGRLRSSITWTIGHDSRGLVATVGTNVDYAIAVHEGTRPHLIEPRNATVLHFSAGGSEVFVTRVNHPGTKGTPFLRDALRAAV